jgi:hypothetical protein
MRLGVRATTMICGIGSIPFYCVFVAV